MFQHTHDDYKVIVDRVDLKIPRVKELLDHYVDVFTREEIMVFALGMIGPGELIGGSTNPLTLPDELWELRKLVREHLKSALPHGFLNDKCFSLIIEPYNEFADVYIFTKEIPTQYAETRYGINFKYISEYFKRQ